MEDRETKSVLLVTQDRRKILTDPRVNIMPINLGCKRNRRREETLLTLGMEISTNCSGVHIDRTDMTFGKKILDAEATVLIRIKEDP